MSLDSRWVEDECIHIEYCDLGCCKLNSCWECGHYETTVVVDYQHQRKPFEGHYPDKKEAKLLRRIMSQTGLTEVEVRGIKKYRVMLSETQKANRPTFGTRCEKYFKELVKRATKQTALATKHPKTIEVVEELLVNDNNWRARGHKDCNNCRHMLAELKKKQGHVAQM